MPAIFISYRKKDTGGHVGHLRSDLSRFFGRKAVFTDFDSIEPGAKWMERIEQALRASDVALIVIGENWVAGELDSADGRRTRRIDEDDDVLRKEVAAALSHPDMAVVPILVEDAQPLEAGDLPEELAGLPELHACRLRNEQWDTDFARIRRVVQSRGDESRWRRLLARLRLAAGSNMAALAFVAVAVLALAGVAALAVDGDGQGCDNLNLPGEVRGKLSEAAGMSDPAEQGVYYGSCGSRHWAIATFAESGSTVFVQEGLRWRELGPTGAYKCDRIPSELLDEWRVNDC